MRRLAKGLGIVAAISVLTACGVGGQGPDDQVCSDALSHMAACMPERAINSELAVVCDSETQAEAQAILGLGCDQLSAALASSGKADSPDCQSGQVFGCVFEKVTSWAWAVRVKLVDVPADAMCTTPDYVDEEGNPVPGGFMPCDYLVRVGMDGCQGLTEPVCIAPLSERVLDRVAKVEAANNPEWPDLSDEQKLELCSRRGSTFEGTVTRDGFIARASSGMFLIGDLGQKAWGWPITIEVERGIYFPFYVGMKDDDACNPANWANSEKTVDDPAFLGACSLSDALSVRIEPEELKNYPRKTVKKGDIDAYTRDIYETSPYLRFNDNLYVDVDLIDIECSLAEGRCYPAR